MFPANIDRRALLMGSAAAAAALVPFPQPAAAQAAAGGWQPAAIGTTLALTRTATPDWLLAMWKEIDDKTFGPGLDCFATDAVCNLGVADWHGRETIRANLRAAVSNGLNTHHEVVEYWDAGPLKIFHGIFTMKFDNPSVPTARPTMTHFFYMDQADPTKVGMWKGSVGPVVF